MSSGVLKPFRAAVNWIARSPGRAFIIIFLLGFAIRCFFLTLVPLQYVQPHTRFEVEAVAFSLAQSGQYANPYMIPSGPTAHMPPMVPGILALMYTIFGSSLLAGYLNWLWRLASYAALFALLPWIAGRLGVGRQAGVIGGITGAVLAQWPGYNEGLTAIVMALL